MSAEESNEPPDLSDPPLSKEALRALLDHRARFFEFLSRRVGSPELAEELLQEALTKAVERGGQLRDDDTVIAWFFRILRNGVVDLHRRRRTASRALEQLAEELTTTAGEEELTREVCACVTGVLTTLKPEYQAAVRAVDLGGQELRAFAREAGISPNHAAVRLHRARASLARRLRTTCGICADHGCVDCTCEHPRSPTLGP